MVTVASNYDDDTGSCLHDDQDYDDDGDCTADDDDGGDGDDAFFNLAMQTTINY